MPAEQERLTRQDREIVEALLAGATFPSAPHVQRALNEVDALRAELQAARERGDRAVVIAEHLFQMIPKEVWRDRGVEYMGQYEGDYWAEQTREEIQALAAQRTEKSN